MVRLPLPPNFSFDAVVRSLGWYDLPPFEYDREKGELRTFVEILPLPPGEGRGEGGSRAGQAAPITFRTRQGRLEAIPENLAPNELRSAARRVFSLDLDLDPFAAALAGEPSVARALSRRGGRILRAPTLFEDAVKILFTTNCSWAATRGMVTHLIAEAGVDGRAFPTARRVARLTVPTLKKKVRCGYRAEALARLSRRVASGRLDLSAWERLDRPGAFRPSRGGDSRRDPRRARFRSVCRGRASSDSGTPRLSRARFLDPAEVPPAPSGSGRLDRPRDRPPLCAVRNLSRSGAVARADRELACGRGAGVALRSRRGEWGRG